MSVFNGQPVDADTTNAAFMSRTQNTDTVGKVSLLNTGSALIDDSQKYINKIADSDGIINETDTTNKTYSSTNVVANGDNRKVAIGKLDAEVGSLGADVADHEVRLDAAELDITVLQSDLFSHTSNTSNPHATTAAQVGADPTGTAASAVAAHVAAADPHAQYLTASEGNAAYDALGAASSAVAAHVAAADPHTQYLTSSEGDSAYLKRGAGDYNSFTSKTTPIAADVVLIEDSADSFNKKKITLTNLIGGGGGGAINFITNSDGLTGTTGWVEGSYTAATRPSGTFTASSGTGSFAISTTSTNPLGNGTTSFLLTKSSGASRQGRAIEYEFNLGLDYRAKVLSIQIDYIINSGTFVAGSGGSSPTDSSLIWYASFYDGTNYTLVEPSSFKLLSNSSTISDIFRAEVQTPYNATKMKLIAYVAETATTAWEVKAVMAVSPSSYVFGTPITDWDKYPVTVTSDTGSVTNHTTTGYFRRVGSNYEISCNAVFSAASASFGNIKFSIPSGLTIDTTKNMIGSAFVLDSGSALYNATTAYASTSSIVVYVNNTAGTYSLYNGITNTVPITFNSLDQVGFTASFPVVGASSSVQMSDQTSTRVIAANIGAGAQNWPIGIQQTVNYSDVFLDETASFNSSTKTYTVPVAGDYDIEAWIGFSHPVTVSIPSVVYLIINNNVGATAITSDCVASVKAGSFGTNSPLNRISKTIALKAGDTIRIDAIAYGTTAAGSVTVRTEGGLLNIRRISGPNQIAASETVGMLYTGSPAPTGSLGAALNLVTYGTKIKDSHGSYVGGIYTIQSSGQFDISAAIAMSATFALGGISEIEIFIDGAKRYGNQIRSQVAHSGVMFPMVSVQSVPLIAGQTVAIYAYCNGTSPSFIGDAAYNYFSISRSGNY